MIFLSKLGDLQKKQGPHRNSKVFFGRNQKFKGFFPAEYWWSPNKKKRSSPKFKGFFQPKSEIQGFVSGRNHQLKVFFRPNAGDLQTKKGLHQNSNEFFQPKSEIQGFFLAECRWSPTKKRSSPKFKAFFWPKSGDIQKIGLHRLWVSSWTKKLHYSGPNNGKSFTTSAPKSLWGRAVFIFGAKIGLKSTRNVLFCIFFRPMGEARAPPTLNPGYATGRLSTTVIY